MELLNEYMEPLQQQDSEFEQSSGTKLVLLDVFFVRDTRRRAAVEEIHRAVWNRSPAAPSIGIVFIPRHFHHHIPIPIHQRRLHRINCFRPPAQSGSPCVSHLVDSSVSEFERAGVVAEQDEEFHRSDDMCASVLAHNKGGGVFVGEGPVGEIDFFVARIEQLDKVHAFHAADVFRLVHNFVYDHRAAAGWN